MQHTIMVTSVYVKVILYNYWLAVNSMQGLHCELTLVSSTRPIPLRKGLVVCLTKACPKHCKNNTTIRLHVIKCNQQNGRLHTHYNHRLTWRTNIVWIYMKLQFMWGVSCHYYYHYDKKCSLFNSVVIHIQPMVQTMSFPDHAHQTWSQMTVTQSVVIRCTLYMYMYMYMYVICPLPIL